MRIFLLCVLSLFVCSSCSLFRVVIPEQWEEAEFDTQNRKVLYEAIALGLGKSGFKVGIGANPGAGEIVTGWAVQESPFKSKGFRERAIVNFGSSADGEGSQVRVRVERETNESLRPLVKGSAKWQPDQDNLIRARRVVTYIEAYLAPSE